MRRVWILECPDPEKKVVLDADADALRNKIPNKNMKKIVIEAGEAGKTN